MLVFIDESGDAGFKLDSSPCLVMAMVIFDSYADADDTRNRITMLGNAMRIKPEFRFTNCSDAVRAAFFREVQPCRFRVRGIVMRKTLIHSHHLRNHPPAFYNYALRQLITRNSLQRARIRIDGNAKKEFLKEAKAYLRRETPTGMMESLKFLDSEQEALIQLADMVTGAIARVHNRPQRSDAAQWYGMIRTKVEDVWQFQ